MLGAKANQLKKTVHSTVKPHELQTRFIVRVLIPPVLLLVILGVFAYMVFGYAVTTSKVDSLGRVATATADKLSQEFELRKNVLVSTGTSLLAGADSRSSISSKERLDLFTQFFPETSYIAVADETGKIISDVSSDETKGFSDATAKTLQDILKTATKSPVAGRVLTNEDSRYAVFAYPIEGGTALSMFALDSGGFMRTAWQDAPIDSSQSYMLFVDGKSGSSYPSVARDFYKGALESSVADGKTAIDYKSKGTDTVAVKKAIEGSDWSVIVSSPKVLAYGDLANTQIVIAAVLGMLIVGFLWTGSVFVRRTVDSIKALVAGAAVFSGGLLTYRIPAETLSDAEFSRLADIMNSMAERIKTAEDAVDAKNKEFISVATHEIRAPITGVIGFLSMVLEDPKSNLSDENKEMLRLAFTGTERLRDLVNDLLDIARLESGKIEYEYSQVDLLKAINDTLGLQRAFAVEHGSTLMLTGMDAVEFVYTDKAKLTDVLTNIVSNAVKYGRKDGGLVEVSVVHDDDFARVAIKDNGLGIPADQQGKMFEKFFRVSTPERAEIVGTGLGMHISKQYIEEMGGKLWFDSVEGQGTTFYFTVALKPGATSGTLDTKKEDAASA